MVFRFILFDFYYYNFGDSPLFSLDVILSLESSPYFSFSFATLLTLAPCWVSRSRKRGLRRRKVECTLNILIPYPSFMKQLWTNSRLGGFCGQARLRRSVFAR